MAHYRQSTSAQKVAQGIAAARRHTVDRAADRGRDEGVTLIEVVVAFTVLMIALIPLSYLFSTSVIQAGQSTNEQTALSIAEQWVETLSNVTPPVNANGEVIVNRDSAPLGPAAGTATLSAGFTVPTSLATPTSVGINVPNTLVAATSTNPQPAILTNSSGTQDSITYTGQTYNGSGQITTLTGVGGWSQSETFNNGGAVNQTSNVVTSESKGGTTYNLLAEYEWTSIQGSGNGAQPNLCTAGTPQLLRVRMTVSWGPQVDTNNVQDSVVIDYPPAGIQTLGFIALQVNGDSTAVDSQANPWSTRVQAPPVYITGTQQTMTIYPDQNGCAFAQVEPGTYTVSISNASSGQPYSNDNYGSPPFVEDAQPTLTGNQYAQPLSYSTTATVTVGSVSRLTTFFDQGSVVNLSYPSSSSTEDGVVCPGVGVLSCISSGEGGGSGGPATADLTVFNQSTNQWSAASLPAGVSRIASVACSTSTSSTPTRCIGVGYGTAGAVIVSAPTSTGTFAQDTIPAGITSLSQVVCPASTGECVAIGTTASGAAVLSGAISTATDTWTNDAITASPTTATIAGLGNLACPASSGGCIATGTSTSPTAGTPIVVSGGYGLGWTESSPNPTSVTLTSIAALACPTTAASTTCLITGTTSTGPEVVSGVATAGLGVAAPSWAWTADAFPSGTTMVSLNGLYCPQTTECLLTGRTASAPVVLYGATTASATFTADALPPTVTSLTQMACPSTGVCVLIGATASGPAIISGAITGSTTPDNWVLATIPSVTTGYTLTQLSQVFCWSITSCAITGVGTNASSQPVAFLLASSGSTTSWSSEGLPTGNPALYLTGIGCVQTGTTYCSAVGAGASGAVELVSSGGPTGTWSDETATGLSGLTTTGVPVEINNANLKPSTYQTFITAGWTTPPATPLPPLYPFINGYSTFAGDCQNESVPGLNVVQATTIPGGTSSATVPLGLLSVQVLHSTGNSIGLPYAATLSLQSTATGLGCGADIYPLQSAGVDGLSRTEVPYGTYTLTITTAGGTTAVSSVNVGGSSVTVGASTYLLPTPIPEKVT
jgi:Tfp pilus assembly protein PilV